MKLLTVGNIYLLLFFLYFSQGPFFPDGTAFSRLLLAGIFLISFWYMAISVTRNDNSHYPKTLFFFVLFLSAYCLFFPHNHNANNIYQLKAIYLSLLPFFPVYYLTGKGRFTRKHLYFLLIIPLITTIFVYFYHAQQMLYAAEVEGSQTEEFTNNFGYVFVFFLPLLCILNKSRLLQLALTFLCYFFIFMSAKRGAILIGTFCVLFILVDIIRNSKNGKNRFWAFFLVVLFAIIGYVYFGHIFQESSILQKTVEKTLEGNSSGRDMIYSRLWDYWTSPELPVHKFLFGSGYSATVGVTGGRYAHSDWLELLVNCGLLGAFLYLWLYIALLRDAWNMRHKLPGNMVWALYMIIFINFMQSFFSMSYLSESHYILSLTLGYLLACKLPASEYYAQTSNPE